MRIVHVQLDGVEEIGHLTGGLLIAVDEVLGAVVQVDLVGGER